ncbi:hypothetical protein C8J57DRAFT_1230602 [Mycena rebaudengoi]|nr:hypothetical protein C8J57DRAFT_1230602 [Mycena rebaudengoi]
MDVFRAVYTGLRLAVLPAEYETLADREDKAGVDGSYYTRCKLRPDGPERQLETLKGVKRVDFLKGRSRFLGVSGPIGSPHVWELNVTSTSPYKSTAFGCIFGRRTFATQVPEPEKAPDRKPVWFTLFNEYRFSETLQP